MPPRVGRGRRRDDGKRLLGFRLKGKHRQQLGCLPLHTDPPSPLRCRGYRGQPSLRIAPSQCFSCSPRAWIDALWPLSTAPGAAICALIGRPCRSRARLKPWIALLPVALQPQRSLCCVLRSLLRSEKHAAGPWIQAKPGIEPRRVPCLPFVSIDASASLHTTTPHRRALHDRHGARAAAWFESVLAAGCFQSSRGGTRRGRLQGASDQHERTPQRVQLDPTGVGRLVASPLGGVAVGRWRWRSVRGALIDRSGRKKQPRAEHPRGRR